MDLPNTEVVGVLNEASFSYLIVSLDGHVKRDIKPCASVSMIVIICPC